VSGRRRLSASGRVAATVTLVLAAGVIVVSLVAYVSVVRAARADLDQSLLREVDAYSAALTPIDGTDERDLAQASRAYLSRRTGGGQERSTILLVRLSSGRILSNTELRLEDAPGNDRLLDVDTTVRGFDDLEYEGIEYRAITAPVFDSEGNTVAVFQAAYPTAQLASFARTLGLSLLGAGLAVVLVGAVISRWAARTSLAPLTEMARTAARVTHSSLGERIHYAGPSDELGTLAASLNEMLHRIEEAFAEQRRFIADASHELRTPVAVMRGNLGLIEHPATTEEEKEEALRIIDEEVRRMARILDDLLSLARMRAGVGREFQPLDLAVLTTEVAARAKTLGDRVIATTCNSGTWVSGDPDLLEQAMLNIVRNAIAHTDDGGRIEITCGAAGPSAVMTIADDGPGIPEDALDRVFDRFYRAQGPRPAESGGSGLGLAIVKGLVELHGGTVAVANRDIGTGAVFTITLPRMPRPSSTGGEGTA